LQSTDFFKKKKVSQEKLSEFPALKVTPHVNYQVQKRKVSVSPLSRPPFGVAVGHKLFAAQPLLPGHKQSISTKASGSFVDPSTEKEQKNARLELQMLKGKLKEFKIP